jgi:hypothetical protein
VRFSVWQLRTGEREKMKQPDVWVGTPEDINEGIEDGHLQLGAVFMVLGERGMLMRQEASRRAAQ